jgi:nucleotide-binding universal stress UspA family protein
MPGIVCAIRGGPDSLATINKAIHLAQEVNQALNFLYVIDLEFLSRTMSGRVRTLSAEIRQMGEFILLSAQIQAEEEHISAETFIMRGGVTDSIIALCNDLDANYVVVGQPLGRHKRDVFTQENIKWLSKRLEVDCGAQVIFVE